MEVLCVLCGYFSLCFVIYSVFEGAGVKSLRLPIPPAAVYYALSFLWGMPVTLAGCVAALVMKSAGRIPEKRGYNWFFRLKKAHWGLDLGLFAFVPENCGDRMIAHEHGHGIQNAWIGPFMLFTVIIPSAVRFWYRFFRTGIRKKPLKNDYDSIWFEASATLNGKRVLEKCGGKNVSV